MLGQRDELEIAKEDLLIGGGTGLETPEIHTDRQRNLRDAGGGVWRGEGETRKFLGFSFSKNKEPKRRIAPKALLRCKQKIRELTRRTRGISLEQMLKELTAYLRGWKSYFGFCQTPSVLQQLDQWIRHRLRSMIWKQWKHGNQRYAKLRQLGVSRNLAAQTAGSPHGPWRLANSPALAYALPLAYFDSLDLPRPLDGLA